MIEIINKEEKAILVCQIDEVNLDSKVMVNLKKPQVIHMYAYDIHLLFTRINIPTLIYYIDRFKIDYLALNIPLTKYIKTSQQIINQLKAKNHHVIIICTGDAITPQIAKDIGSDGYTLSGDDIIRVMEYIDHKRSNYFGLISGEHKEKAINEPVLHKNTEDE